MSTDYDFYAAETLIYKVISSFGLEWVHFDEIGLQTTESLTPKLGVHIGRLE